MIYLRFATELDQLDQTIAAQQFGYWATHVEVFNPLAGALRYDDNEERWRWTFEQDNWQMQLIATIPCEARQRDSFYRFLYDHVVGRPYDMRSLAKIGYQLTEHSLKKWNCSDFIYLGMHEAGLIKSLPPHIGCITPRDLLLICGTLTELSELVTKL